MKKILQFTLTFIGLTVVLVAVLGGLKLTQFKAMGQAGGMAQPATVVTTAEVKSEVWEPTLTAIGSLAPFQGVTVTTESSGIVSKIFFEAGSQVKEGDLLISLDTSVLDAQLQSTEAAQELARLNAERSRELFAKNTSAKSELDSAEAAYKQASAEVASIKAQLAQKQVRAPFGGRLGIRQINVGQFLDRGAAIVSLQSLDPVYVNFTLPQQEMGSLSSGLKVRLYVDALPGKEFVGKISAINPEVDNATRSVRVQAILANPGEVLRPGMFVNVAVVLPSSEQVSIIPVTSVLYAPYGDSVFVIEEKVDEKSGQKGLSLRQQFVRLGKARGDYVQIVSGLKPGEKIVTTGVFKLRNGMAVTIDNTLAPEVSETPKPANS